MKRLYSLFAFLLCSLVVLAQEFAAKGINFKITSTDKLTVEAIGGDYSGNCVIPEKVAYNGKEYSVTCIGDKFAAYNFDLTSVKIPKSVTSIVDGAFFECRSLTSIVIPNSVTSIGESAFGGCTGLSEIHSLIKTPFAINDNTFWCMGRKGPDKKTLYKTIKLYVPKGTVSAYKATKGWKKFKKIIEE